MRKLRVLVFGVFVAAAVMGTAVLVGTSTGRAAPERVVVKDHWRHHDGHWSYWDDSDKHWYYTNGENWFVEDGEAWKVYRFDKHFGREGFERGEYKVPGEDVKVVVPRHRVYRP